MALYAGYPWILKELGEFLVVSDPLRKSDAIVVLWGDGERDERLLHAVQLWKNGYGDRVIISARKAEWQTDEDISEWRHVLKLKITPPSAFLLAIQSADSTKEEARMLLPFARKYGFKSVIVVTSNYHTRRTKKIFQKEWRGSGIQFIVSAAPSSEFHPDEWWRNRADSRTFYFEFSKTIWYALRE